VGCEDKTDTSNKKGSWKHLKIIQKMPEQNTWKAGHPRTKENSHIRHCALTSENTNVKAQNTQHGK
jgi:hypothetical protein